MVIMYGGLIGTHQLSFEWYHSRPHTASFPKIVGSQPHSKLQFKILGNRVLIEEGYVWRAYRNSPTFFRAVPSEQKPIKFSKK